MSSKLDKLTHVGIGSGCLMTVLISIYISEKDLINFVKQQIKSKIS